LYISLRQNLHVINLSGELIAEQVNWQTVLWGVGLQFIFAVIVLRWPAGYAVFKWLGDRVSAFIACSDAGAKFVFGDSYRDHFVAFQVSQ